MTKTVAAFDRARAWCAPLAPPALTRVAGYDTFRRRVRIVADFASPTRLAIFGRETIPAGVLVSLAAAAAGFVADRRAAATRSVVAPVVTRGGARRLDVVVDATDGSVVVRDELRDAPRVRVDERASARRPRDAREEHRRRRRRVVPFSGERTRAASIAVVRRVHAGLGGLVAVAPRTIAASYLDPADATPKTFSSAAAAWFADVEGDDAHDTREDIVGTYRRRKRTRRRGDRIVRIVRIVRRVVSRVDPRGRARSARRSRRRRSPRDDSSGTRRPRDECSRFRIRIRFRIWFRSASRGLAGAQQPGDVAVDSLVFVRVRAIVGVRLRGGGIGRDGRRGTRGRGPSRRRRRGGDAREDSRDSSIRAETRRAPIRSARTRTSSRLDSTRFRLWSFVVVWRKPVRRGSR